MAEKSECDKLRAKVVERRNALGYKFTRHLNMAEGQGFLDTNLVPADALSKSTFAAAKRLEGMPSGSTCMVCGLNMSGGSGWIVEVATPSGRTFRTICEAHYEAVMNGKNESEPEHEEEPAVAVASATPVATAAPADPVAAALQTLTAALTAPKAPPAPPVDEAKILAGAVEAAKEQARKEAQEVLRKSVSDILRDGATAVAGSAEGGEGEEIAKLASATGDGCEAAAKAHGWSAKATPAAKDAVGKLNKFLSEFSYFRDGASMRLINSFAIAADKKACLQSYCEVSQMEDLPDLVEKMKSPEFTAVCDAFAPFKPKPLNRRFAVFYGAPGGGKTYAAIKAGESINGGQVDVVPCSPSMDAADTLYAYRLDYKTGKRGYVPTALLTAMVSGRAVVLDEVNLLPMEARMFLQNILDNKDKVHVMGVELPIADGFFVLGTMNLETGLGAQPLPLPLVDRAVVVRKFATSVSQAAVGAGLC